MRVVIINAFAGAGTLPEQLRARCWHIAADEAQREALWRPDLERFGAAQLNARFQAMHNRQMTANAWAGWFSVKVAWEAAVRTRTTQPERIAAFLASGAAFDGHKGEPLTFDPATRVLQQPLYVESSE